MLDQLIENYPILTKILICVGAFYKAATAIALITPTDKDNTFLEKVGKWADKVGFKIKGD